MWSDVMNKTIRVINAKPEFCFFLQMWIKFSVGVLTSDAIIVASLALSFQLNKAPHFGQTILRWNTNPIFFSSWLFRLRKFYRFSHQLSIHTHPASATLCRKTIKLEFLFCCCCCIHFCRSNRHSVVSFMLSWFMNTFVFVYLLFRSKNINEKKQKHTERGKKN